MTKDLSMLMNSFFLTHSKLMTDLKSWASAASAPFVDIIAATNGNRDVLLSWVHLSPRGNQMVAQAFAKEILRHECTDPHAALERGAAPAD